MASDLNNTITYNRTGTGNVNIKQSFDGYHNLIIDGNNVNSDKRIVNAVRVLNDLIINGSTQLQFDTVSLFVGGDFILNGGEYLFNQGTVIFNGSSPQLISGELTFNDLIINSTSSVSVGSDTVTLIGHMTLPSGDFNTNDRFILESISTRDARIGIIAPGSTVSGDVIVQRHIPQGATDWRFMGSQITNATFEGWDDDFVTSGFPGSDFPNFYFTSIYGYDETVVGHQDSGFVTITGSDNIIPGRGYWVFCGDSLSGTNAFTVDLTGPINQGAVNLNPTYTALTSLEDDGWNLVSNPYPCPIDWDSPNWTRLNIDSAIYIWNTNEDQYSSYSNGVGLFGGSSIVAAGQGFFVKANLALPILIAQESVKYDTNALFLKTKPIDDLITRLTLDQDGDRGETIIRVNNRSTTEYEGNLEAYHIPGFGDNRLNIYTEIDDSQISINAIPANGTSLVPLRLIAKTGNAQLPYQNEIIRDNFCILLWNTITNEQTLLDESGAISIEFDSDEAVLEYMVVISRISNGNTSACEQLLGIEDTKLGGSIGYYSNNSITINSNALNQDYQILDAKGRVVRIGRTTDNVITLKDCPRQFISFKWTKEYSSLSINKC